VRFCSLLSALTLPPPTHAQFLLWAAIFVVAVILKIPFPMNDGNAWVIIGALFPAFIALCAVFRFTLLRRIISLEHLDVLDPAPGTFEDGEVGNRGEGGEKAAGGDVELTDSDEGFGQVEEGEGLKTL
jgi:hypothetical protein